MKFNNYHLSPYEPWNKFKKLRMKFHQAFILMIFSAIFLGVTDEMIAHSDSLQSHTPFQFESDFQSKYNARNFRYKLPEKNENHSSPNSYVWMEMFVSIMKYIFYVFILVGVWVIFRELLKKIKPEVKEKALNNHVGQVMEIDETNLKGKDLNEFILYYKSMEEYRWALRYLFLELLLQMADMNLILWDTDKTNTEYRSEIKSPWLSEKFEHISRTYEYYWYGEKKMDKRDFVAIENRIIDTLNRLKEFEKSSV